MRMDFYGISKGIIKNFEENLKNKNSACMSPFLFVTIGHKAYILFFDWQKPITKFLVTYSMNLYAVKLQLQLTNA